MVAFSDMPGGNLQVTGSGNFFNGVTLFNPSGSLTVNSGGGGFHDSLSVLLGLGLTGS